jgi:hypothetical protein
MSGPNPHKIWGIWCGVGVFCISCGVWVIGFWWCVCIRYSEMVCEYKIFGVVCGY